MTDAAPTNAANADTSSATGGIGGIGGIGASTEAPSQPRQDPLSVFQVGALSRSGTATQAQQQLCAQFADHRGRIDLPTYGVLFDHIGGIPFAVTASASGALSLQARLTMSALGHVNVGDRLICDADVAMADDHTGVTPVSIRTQSGRLCCIGTARNMRVGRLAADDTSAAAMATLPDCTDAQSIRLPEPIPPTLSGRDIITQIAAQTRDIGPLASLLNGRVELIDERGALRFTATTESWMGNHFGTMHGGVIATIVGQAISFAGQAQAAAGRDYQIAEMSAGFFRSPAVDGAAVIVEVDLVKTGRRVASFIARMSTHDGTLLCEAVADVHFR